jgi:hypothetical protein
MRWMNYCMMLITSGLLLISMEGCKKGCDGEDPRARIVNGSTDKASVQIKTSGGNTVNINDVEAGSASAFSSYAAGETTFTLKISNVDYVKTVTMGNCYDYDIALDVNNNITVTLTNRD